MDWVIETKNLTKRYHSKPVVNDLSIHVQQGRIYGLLGRNGAGKTTLMKMLLGLTSITEGQAWIFGSSVADNKQTICPRIGSMIESSCFYPHLTGTENLEIFAQLRGISSSHAIKQALDVVGLTYHDKKPFKTYSLGMKQRLGIANSILHNPDLLILDEPTNGLDPIGIVELRDFLKRLCTEQQKTIFISSHILSEISLLADDIGILHHGTLLEESSLQKLEEKKRKYIAITCSDVTAAALVLEHEIHTTNFSIQSPNLLHLFDASLHTPAIIKAFVMNDIEVSTVQPCDDTLEAYFKQITQDTGIA